MQFHRTFSRAIPVALSLLLAVPLLLMPSMAQAQGHVNDHDMEALMRNLRDDAKSFRPHFDDAVHKSTVRKTSQERQAHDLAATFEKQTQEMLEQFKKNRSGQSDFSNVMATAKDIDQSVRSLSLGPRVDSDWNRIRTELEQIAAAYGMPDTFEGADDGMAPMRSEEKSCLETAGAEKSKRLVNECLQVSPATHPPCNAQNSCDLIVGEIERSCALMGANAPSFCNQYH